MTSQMVRPAHDPAAARAALAEVLGQPIPEVTDDERDQILAEMRDAAERARHHYGHQRSA